MIGLIHDELKLNHYQNVIKFNFRQNRFANVVILQMQSEEFQDIQVVAK